jgi:hypothetical protein
MSDTNAQAVDSGPLSIDQAVAALLPQEEQPEAPQEAASEEITEASPEAEEPEVAAETPSEEGEVEAETVDPVDAPHFWAAEHKEAFAKLPPELQAIVKQHEDSRVAASNKAIQEAREAEKRATETATKAAETSAKLTAQVDTWEQRFAAKWPNEVDWVATLNQCVEQFGAEQGTVQYNRLRAEYDADESAIAAAKTAKQQAEQSARAEFAKAEFERLKTVAPELTDPKQGPELFKKVTSFLAEKGIGADKLADAGADEWAIALDAMRYRESLAKAQQALKAPPKPVPAAKPVAPAAAQAGTPQQRSAQQVKNRFAQTRSVDDAVELLLSRK